MSNCKDEVCNGRFVPQFSVSALKETISKLFHSKISTGFMLQDPQCSCNFSNIQNEAENENFSVK